MKNNKIIPLLFIAILSIHSQDVSMEQRFLGVVFGGALGDAMGRRTEFINSMEKIRRKFGPNGIHDIDQAISPRDTHARVTDDTQMSLAVLHAFIDADDNDVFYRLMAGNFVSWYNQLEGPRAAGKACKAGCKTLKERLKDPTFNYDVHAQRAAGCGSVMRVYPVGLMCYKNKERLRLLAVEQSKLTTIGGKAHGL